MGRGYVARLNADGSLDTTFNPGANGAVSTMVLQAPGYGAPTSQNGSSLDQILVGGSFTTIAGPARNYLARLNYDGSIDATYNPNPDNIVSALAIQAGWEADCGRGVRQCRRPAAQRLRPAGHDHPEHPHHLAQLRFQPADLDGGGRPRAERGDLRCLDGCRDLADPGLCHAGRRRQHLAIDRHLSSLAVRASPFYILVLGQSFTSQGGSTSIFGTTQEFNVAALAVIKTSSTATAAAVNGGPFYYEIAAANFPTAYAASGLPAGLTINPATGVISGTPTQSGVFNVTLAIANYGGTITAPLTITVAAAAPGGNVAPLARLINLSTRSAVTYTNPLLDGFVITGPATQDRAAARRGSGIGDGQSRDDRRPRAPLSGALRQQQPDRPGRTAAGMAAAPSSQIFSGMSAPSRSPLAAPIPRS